MQELILFESKLSNKISFDRLVKSFTYNKDIPMKDNLYSLSAKVI